ncbi:MAG TPA: O-methyltransferase [Acidimicrobiales bacterium]|nr:O-methyltransferase [Acidimicrobiales bacterium]
MSKELWTNVDGYLVALLAPSDDVLDRALSDSDAAGLPQINVAPNQGKLLKLLATSHGARRILEIGTLGGYSTIWLARSLPEGGRLISLELESKHADVARSNIDRAGLGSLVEIRVGPAASSLRDMIGENVEPFDFIFIDADKEGYPEYFDLSLELSHVGTVIVADNVVRAGEIINPRTEDERVRAVRSFLELVALDERVEATAVQTVGSKGYDGFALMLVTK